MSDNFRYATQIFFSEDDGGYIAIVPDLPGCSAFGETPEEALKESRDAIKAWIGAAQKAGNPVPPPSKHREEALPSGKILLRLPKTLHARLLECAERDGTSLNTCLVSLLAQSVVEKAFTSTKPANVQTAGSAPAGNQVVIYTTVTSHARMRSFFGGMGFHEEQSPLSRLASISSHGATEYFEVDTATGKISTREELDVRRLPAGTPVIYVEK